MLKKLWQVIKLLFGKEKLQTDFGDADVKPKMLIIGLGNPGEKYGGTRHNIGFDVIDKLRTADGVCVLASGFFCESECYLAQCGNGKKNVLLVKPQTYMNLSGDAASALISKYNLTAADCVVIVDDFNIPLGKIRIRKDGSHGGHNGLKSVTAEIGGAFPRVRVGIGPLPKGAAIIDFVLGKFDESEADEVSRVVKLAADAALYMVDNGLDTAMNRFN